MPIAVPIRNGTDILTAKLTAKRHEIFIWAKGRREILAGQLYRQTSCWDNAAIVPRRVKRHVGLQSAVVHEEKRSNWPTSERQQLRYRPEKYDWVFLKRCAFQEDLRAQKRLFTNRWWTNSSIICTASWPWTVCSLPIRLHFTDVMAIPYILPNRKIVKISTAQTPCRCDSLYDSPQTRESRQAQHIKTSRP